MDRIFLIFIIILLIIGWIGNLYIKSTYGSYYEYRKAVKFKKRDRSHKYILYFQIITFILLFYAGSITVICFMAGKAELKDKNENKSTIDTINQVELLRVKTLNKTSVTFNDMVAAIGIKDSSFIKIWDLQRYINRFESALLDGKLDTLLLNQINTCFAKYGFEPLKYALPNDALLNEYNQHFIRMLYITDAELNFKNYILLWGKYNDTMWTILENNIKQKNLVNEVNN